MCKSPCHTHASSWHSAYTMFCILSCKMLHPMYVQTRTKSVLNAQCLLWLQWFIYMPVVQLPNRGLVIPIWGILPILANKYANFESTASIISTAVIQTQNHSFLSVLYEIAKACISELITNYSKSWFYHELPLTCNSFYLGHVIDTTSASEILHILCLNRHSFSDIIGYW